MSLVSLKRWKAVIASCSVVHAISVTAWRVDSIVPIMLRRKLSCYTAVRGEGQGWDCVLLFCVRHLPLHLYLACGKARISTACLSDLSEPPVGRVTHV